MCTRVKKISPVPHCLVQFSTFLVVGLSVYLFKTVVTCRLSLMDHTNSTSENILNSSEASTEAVVFRQCYSNDITTYLIHPVENDIKINNIALGLINSFLAICGSFSNFFVIVTYLRARDRSMRRLSNMLVIALACSDLIVTLLIQTLYVLRKAYYEINGSHNCVLFAILRLGIYYSCGVSGIISILVTAERYIAIAKPYSYPVLINRTRLKTIVFTIWIVYFIFICSRLWFTPNFVLNIVTGIIAILFLICTSSMWIHIFIITKRHEKAIKRQLSGLSSIEQYKDNYLTTYIIILSTTLCSIPAILMSAYGSFFNHVNFTYLYIFLPWAETLVFFNSFRNSVIFTWREKKFRFAFKALLRRNAVAPMSQEMVDLSGKEVNKLC